MNENETEEPDHSTSELPEARTITSRSARLVAALEKKLWSILWLLVIVAVLGGGVLLTFRHDNNLQAEYEAACWSRAEHLENVVRIQRADDGFYVYQREQLFPSMSEHFISRHQWNISYVIDVSSGTKNWIWLHAWWKSGSCKQEAIFHLTSPDDIN